MGMGCEGPAVIWGKARGAPSAEGDNMVIFTNRHGVKLVLPQATAPQLDPDVYETARMLAPGFDVHHLESEWRGWSPETPRNPEAAFLGFCRKWMQNNKNQG